MPEGVRDLDALNAKIRARIVDSGRFYLVQTGLPKAATGLVQGMLLFFLLASDFVARYRIRTVTRHSGITAT